MSKFSFSFFVILILILVIAVPGFSQTRVGKLGIGADGSMQYMLGAGSTNPSPAIGGGVNFSYSAMEGLGLRGDFCYSPISWKGNNTVTFSPDMASLNLYVGADLLPNSTFNLFPFIGGGLAVFDPREDDGSPAIKGGTLTAVGGTHVIVGGVPVSSFDLHIIGGLSIDYFLSEFWSVSLMGEYVLTGSPYYAGSVVVPNTNNDSYLRASIQLRYYFFDSAFIKKLLEAQHARSKHS